MPSKDELWQKLQAQQEALRDVPITPDFDAMHVALDGVLFDYSKHRVTPDVMGVLFDLARASDVEPRRDAMLAGEKINESEDRAVLHMALRSSTDAGVADFVQDTLAQMKHISEDLRANPAITDIVNIGIGGSDMGPRFVCDALAAQSDGPRIHFLSNIDGHSATQLFKTLRPESTAFIVASKTFMTLETMQNARTALAWSERPEQFYAVTGNAELAQDFGIAPDHILPLRDWIGGRYSVWGAIGLPVAIGLGFAAFEDFLKGARAADAHFTSAPLSENIPVIMALLGVWYRNVWDYRAHAILPYAKALSGFPALIQQLDMESNGKAAAEKTSPVIFGGAGTNAQHAFFQHLHQGSDITPADFIAVISPDHDLQDHHTVLLANALAQSQALMIGQDNKNEPHRNFDGNRPSSTFLLDRLDAYHLGMLIALYEHKIFTQGVIWGINSFDQWGVELGKTLAKTLTSALADKRAPVDADPSTKGLLNHIIENS